MIPDIAIILAAYICFRMAEVWFLNTSRYQNRACHVIVSVMAALVIVVTLFVLIMLLASGSSVGLPNLR
jgi:hypothetical protein